MLILGYISRFVQYVQDPFKRDFKAPFQLQDWVGEFTPRVDIRRSVRMACMDHEDVDGKS